MVRMGMRYKYYRNLLPFQIETPQRNLGTLPAIKKKKLSPSTQEYRGKTPTWQGHHAACAEYKYFQY
jgi:hypothetical protein